MLVKCFFSLLCLFLIILPSHAAPKPVKVPSDSIFQAIDDSGRKITCAVMKGRKISGILKGKTQFLSYKSLALDLQSRWKTAENRKRKLKLKIQFQEANSKAKEFDVLCKNYVPGDGNDSPGVPMPPNGGGGDEASMEPYSGEITRQEVSLLLERAGFGLSADEEWLVEIGRSKGASGLVEAFMEERGEDSDLMPRVLDRLDGQLGKSTTQTPGGQRQGLFDLWVHTKNPYAEKMALFLLSVWTVAGDVISDETFRGAFFDYFNKLRDASHGDTYLPDLGVVLARDPLMLIYLSNELNIKGAPNENFARELMELFTLGPEDLDAHPNYSETGIDGSGDIAVAARMLTGWKVKLDYTVNKLVPQYESARHANGPHTMFAGKEYAFSGENDEDLIRGIFAHHPQVAAYYSKEIIKEYLTPTPSKPLVLNFAQILAQNKFNLRAAMAVLLKSKAFFANEYRDTLPKNSIEFAVGAVKVLGLKDAFNFGSADQGLTEMGMRVNLSPSVFWFNPQAWNSPAIQLARVNYISTLTGDSTAQKLPEPDWNPAILFPSGSISGTELIDSVSTRLGLSLDQDVRATLKSYVERELQYDGSIKPFAYNNLNPTHQRQKGVGIYSELLVSPGYQLK